MTAATITKVLKAEKEQCNIYSTGFKRLNALPKRVRKNIALACVLNGEMNDNSIKAHLQSLNETEFVNWLKSN